MQTVTFIEDSLTPAKSVTSSADDGVKALGSVLLIAPQPFFQNRGTPINVRAMVSALAEMGYDVHLLVYPYGDHIEISGVTVHRSWRVPGVKSVPIGPSWTKIALDVWLFFKACLLLAHKRFDLVHGVEEGGVIAWFVSKIRRVPYVFDMDSCMSEQLRDSGFVKSKLILWLIFRIESRCIKSAVSVLTVCQALSDKVRKIAPDVRIDLIEDFPMDSAHSVSSELVSVLKKEFNLQGKAVLLYTGNFESYQGIDLLINSFALLFTSEDYIESFRSADRQPVLLLVGGGDAADPKVMSYKALAENLGISEHVVFVGQRPAEQMGSFMAVADALVSPRVVGGNTPLKIYTYMASGKPVVATRKSTHTQVLDDDNAFLGEATSESFANAILLALEDTPAGRIAQRNKAARSKELVETRYSKEEFGRRLGVLYRSILNKDCKGEGLKN